MPNELRRSLFAAAFAGAALVGCGGGSGNGPAPAPGPTPAPGPPPASAGSYYLTGHAAGNFSGTPVNFVDTSVAPDPYALYFADPLSATPLSMSPSLVAEGVAVDLASVSEWFPDGSNNATAWGTRYRVYFNGNNLFKIDLRKSGSPPAVPAPTQLSSVTVAGAGSQPALCWFGQVLFDNYRSADQSWLLFHAKGADANCGSADDQFVAVEMLMGASAAPLLLKQLEPVEALRDATGLITGYLALNHPAVGANGLPASPVPLQQLNASFAATKTFARTLIGSGVTSSAGDFHSLGVSAGNVWLYADTSDIWAVDLGSGTSTQVTTINAQDFVHGRAVFDGTNAYVAINNNMAGDYVLLINLTTKVATAQAAASNGFAGIDLVGVTSGNLIYSYTDHTALRSVAKTLVGAPIALFATSGTSIVDAPLGSVGGAPAAVYLVGDGVYFTVADSSATNQKQAHYVKGDGTGAAVIGGATTSAVLGTVAGTFPAAGPIANSGALVVTGGVSSPSVSFSRATLVNYGPTGVLAATIGTLPNPATNPITAVAPSSTPMQAGVPAMIEMTGFSTTISAPADDISIFTPDMATTLNNLTTFMQ